MFPATPYQLLVQLVYEHLTVTVDQRSNAAYGVFEAVLEKNESDGHRAAVGSQPEAGDLLLGVEVGLEQVPHVDAACPDSETHLPAADKDEETARAERHAPQPSFPHRRLATRSCIQLPHEEDEAEDDDDRPEDRRYQPCVEVEYQRPSVTCSSSHQGRPPSPRVLYFGVLLAHGEIPIPASDRDESDGRANDDISL